MIIICDLTFNPFDVFNEHGCQEEKLLAGMSVNDLQLMSAMHANRVKNTTLMFSQSNEDEAMNDKYLPKVWEFYWLNFFTNSTGLKSCWHQNYTCLSMPHL